MTYPVLEANSDAAGRYQDVLVPALMETWAPRVADAAAIRPGDRVLDVACGTGVLSRAAASRAAPTGTVTGLDLNPAMLAVAARLSPTLRWKQGTADALPFPDRTFDVVVSQFGLMFFPDPAAALREMMRVLVPGGRLAVAVWASLADTPAPFWLGETTRLAEVCAAAGITGAQVGLHQGPGRFPSIRVMVEADVRGWLPLVGIVLADDVIEEILQRAEVALAPFVTCDSSGVSFASPAVLTTAVKSSPT